MESFSPQEQADLERFAQRESQRVQSQLVPSLAKQSLHCRSSQSLVFPPKVALKVTADCFEKCISSPGARLSSSDSSCLSNCSKRYLDATTIIGQRLAQQLSKSGGGGQFE
jgi:hypothetical protein